MDFNTQSLQRHMPMLPSLSTAIFMPNMSEHMGLQMNAQMQAAQAVTERTDDVMCSPGFGS